MNTYGIGTEQVIRAAFMQGGIAASKLDKDPHMSHNPHLQIVFSVCQREWLEYAKSVRILSDKYLMQAYFFSFNAGYNYWRELHKKPATEQPI